MFPYISYFTFVIVAITDHLFVLETPLVNAMHSCVLFLCKLLSSSRSSPWDLLIQPTFQLAALK